MPSFTLLDALFTGFDFSVMTQSPSVRVLVSLVLIFGMFSIDIPTSHAAVAATTTGATVQAPIITTTTTVQTDPNDAADTSTSTIQEIVTATTSRPVALKTIRVDATSYTSSYEETDGTPELAADGTCTYFGMIAANFAPIGTKVRIPSIYGDKIFTVHDRMNQRYSYRIDVWTADKKDMRQFGIKRGLQVEVIEWGSGETNWKNLIGKKQGTCYRVSE